MRQAKELFLWKPKNKIKLQDDYIKAIQDPEFKSFVLSLPTTEEILMRYTHRLQESFAECKHCKHCEGLEMCKNKQVGYCLTPTANERMISFSYDACPYQVEKRKRESYQENVVMFEMPKALKSATLRNIYTDDKNRIEIIRYFKEFMNSYGTKPVKGLYLYGSFGSGKSYLIASLLNEFAHRGVKSVIVYYPEFLRSLKESFSDNYKEKFNLVCHAPLLLLDDIGAENLTAWSRDEVLGPILQYRMDEKLPTFFTSNLNLEELEMHLSISSSGVDKIKARRIVERIKEVSIPMKLESKNRRG